MKKFAIAAITAVAAIASLSSVAEAHQNDGDWRRPNHGDWGHPNHGDWGRYHHDFHGYPGRYNVIVFRPHCGTTKVVREDDYGNKIVKFVNNCY